MRKIILGFFATILFSVSTFASNQITNFNKKNFVDKHSGKMYSLCTIELTNGTFTWQETYVVPDWGYAECFAIGRARLQELNGF